MAQKAALSHVDAPYFSEMWLTLLALMGVIYRERGKWVWVIAIATTVWIHALFNCQELFAASVPHKRVVEHNNLYTCLNQQHRKHFGQAQESPATIHPISTLFGEDTDTQSGEVFRRGLIKVNQFPGITEGLKLFFKELQWKPTGPPFVEEDITVDKVKAGFKIWKERTSKSPSGLHLGLYK
eukprot:9901424-Ditylum_brightwellii.AAC.1